MANEIKLKRGSGSDPSASDLVVGEVALRTDNASLFTKKDDGNIAEIGAAAGVSDGDKGDITVSNSGATFTIDNDVVSTAKMANMTTQRILGRQASGTGDPQHLTATEARSILNVENGATADQTASEILTLLKTVDGSGSGLDADTLDGVNSTSFVRSDTDDTLQGTYTILDSGNEKLKLSGSSSPYIRFQEGTTNKAFVQWNSEGFLRLQNQEDGSIFDVRDSIRFSPDAGSNFYTVWHAGNDGAGSGLDADLLDGISSASFLRSDANDGFSGTLTAASDGSNPVIIIAGGGPNFIRFDSNDGTASDSIDLIYRTTPNTLAFERVSDAQIMFSVDADTQLATFSGNLDIGAGCDVTGNISCSGTVDGVDIATRDTLFGGLTSSSGVLTNGVIATTQGASDNTTKVATTAYVTTAISNLINGAPSALDTLNELAAAMSDDAAFSTTVTNSIATKLPLTGGTLTGTLTIGDGSAQTELHIKKADNNVADHLQFYNGTTIVGEIGCRDTTWLRINQETNKNIYTPRYIRADGGFFVDSTAKGINGSGNFIGGTIAGASDYGTLLRSDADDITSGSIAFSSDDDGIFLYGGGRFYKKSGTGLMVRLHDGGTQLQVENNSGTVIGTFWHSGNDGSGSGLDADTLDGVQGASFLRSDANDTFTGDLTISGNVYFSDQFRIGDDVWLEDYNAANAFRVKGNQDSNKGFIAFGSQTKKLGCDGASAALTYDGHEVVTQNSNLNASNISSGTIPAARVPTLNQSTTGNAASADTVDITNTTGNSTYYLTFTGSTGQARTIRTDTAHLTYNPNSNVLSAGTFSGSGASLTNLNGSNISSGTVPQARLGTLPQRIGLNVTVGGTPASRNAFLALGDNDTGVAQNGDGQLELWANNQEIMNLDTGSITAYKQVIPASDSSFNLGTSSNRWSNLYADTLYGAGSNITALNGSNISSGTVAAARVATLNQNTTGSAATLTTARTIAGVSFDGSANISLNNNAITNGAGYITGLNFNDLANKDSGTGDYSTSGDFVAGRGSGSIALTVNDGGGNANLTFNHQNRIPDRSGNAARIEVNVDSSSGAAIMFEVKSNVTSGATTTLTNVLDLLETQIKPRKNIIANSDSTVDIGSNAVRFANGYFDTLYGDGSNLTGISAGATGGGSDEVFYENGQTVTTNYTVTNGKNAMSAGPITINSGVTVTVGSGETLTIV